MPDFLSFINEILWGSVMIYLLLGAGIWFSWQTRGIQFRYVRKFGRSLKKSLHPQPGGLTSFQALCTSLAARVGSGNLAGVTLAIAAPQIAQFLANRKNRELAQAIAASQGDSPEVRAAVDHFHDAMGALQKATIAHVFEMRAVLTPEQARVFDREIAGALTQEPR